MENTTVYPYGTGGSLPSNIGIINDLSTGGADKALSAEMGKELGERVNSAIVERELAYSSRSVASVLKTDGAIDSVAYNNMVVDTFIVEPGSTYRISGRVGGYANTCLVAFYDSDGAFIEDSSSFAPGTSTPYHDIAVVAPEGARTMKVAGNTDEQVTPYAPSATAFVIRNGFPVVSRRFALCIGSLSSDTGLYPRSSLTYYLGWSHTAKFIKLQDVQTIKTVGLTGMVYFYDAQQTYLGSSSRVSFNTTEGEYTFNKPTDIPAYYFRLQISNGTFQSVDIESDFGVVDSAFQFLPANGYQPFTFEVRTDKCNGKNTGTSAFQEQFERTTDSGMLHLPASYSAFGKGTPLIIYLHGSANDYSVSSSGFPANCPMAPEWDAAGFAQMDIDLVPDSYNDKNTNANGGSSDDAECVFGAYRWAVEHFNIRRDGVYLMGRSRGGQAVLQTLGKYDPSVMPVVCALSNAGANCIINYGITYGKTVAQWNLLCASFNLPLADRPTPNGTDYFLAQNNIYNFLLANIKQWWRKSGVALGMLTENKSELQTPEEILEYMHLHPSVNGVEDMDYLTFLTKLRYKSPVPIRFDWCVEDTVQTWNANDGFGNYSKITVDGFLNNLSGQSEYREWPSVDNTGAVIEGASARGHFHELYNKVSGDYTLPNGVTLTNPSMARLEWLLWCMSHDNRDL